MDEAQAADLAAYLNSWSGTAPARDRMRVVVDDEGGQVGAFVPITDTPPAGHVFWLRRSGRPPYSATEVLRTVNGQAPLARNVQLPDDVGLLLEQLMRRDPRLTSNVDALRFALETTLNLYPVEGSPDE